MDSDFRQEPGDHASVYPIPDDLVHQQQVVGHYPGNSDYGQQQEEVGCYDDLVRGDFGSERECLLLRRSRYRGWRR